MTPPLHWSHFAFAQLSAPLLYAVLQLRSAVFVVEQACAFQDMDGWDERAWHVCGMADGQLVAYARCFGPGVKYPEVSIGRVAVQGSARGAGWGRAVMLQAMQMAQAKWGPQAIRLDAQAHLRAFYEGLGFVDLKQPFMENDIAHIKMRRPA
jgi:ElaA protein